MKSIVLSTISAGLISLGFIAAAHAQPLRQNFSEAVSYSDIDLNDEAGARVMLRRIERAAKNVCGANDGGFITLQEQAAIRACAKDAAQKVVADLNRPVVTALFEGRQPMTALARR